LQKRAFSVLATAIFCCMLGVGIVAPLLPLYAEEMGASGFRLGMIFAGYSISRTVVMPIAGRLSDRAGRKLLLGLGLLGNALISLSYVGAGSTGEMTLVRLLHGLAAGIVVPVAQAYVGDLSPEAEEGRWMGLYNSAFFTGFGCGPLLGGVITERFGMDHAFLTMGLLNLVAFGLVFLLIPEVKRSRAQQLRRVPFWRMGQSRVLRAIVAYRLSYSFGRGTFVTFVPVVAAIFIGLSPAEVGMVLATSILVMSLLQLYSGYVADRFDRKRLVVIGSLLNASSLALVPLALNFWHLLAIATMAGLGGAISMPAASALAVGEGRTFGMGSTMAIFSMAFSLGMVLGPLSSGLVADLWDLKAVFLVGSGATLLGTAFFAVYGRSF